MDETEEVIIKKPAKKAKAAPAKKAETVQVTEDHTSADSKNAMLHNPETWILVSFLIFVVLAVKYLLPLIGKSLDGRSNQIRDQLEQASRLRAEAEELLKNTQAKHAKLLKDAEHIVATAQRDAVAIRARAAEDLKQALDRRAQQAKEKIERAEADAIRKIRTRIVESATAAAREMLADQASAAYDDEAATRAVAALEQQIH